MARRATLPTVGQLARLVPSGDRYRDPRTGRRFTAHAVTAAKRAAGITPDLTKALTTKGYGRTWQEQVQRVRSFTRATGRGKAPSLGKQFARAAAARDSLRDLVASYRGKVRERTGATLSDADLLGPRSGLWRALEQVSKAKRVTTRAGKAQGVGPDSQLARGLVALGLRPEWATWRVGQSPIPDRVAAFLAREDGAPPPWEALTAEERDRVNAALQEGGELTARPKRATYRQAEADALRAVGRRSANNPRRGER